MSEKDDLAHELEAERDQLVKAQIENSRLKAEITGLRSSSEAAEEKIARLESTLTKAEGQFR